MKTQSIDTNPKTEEVLISILKKESTSKKFFRICSLTQVTFQLSKRAIARQNKNLDKTGVDLLFIEYHYGKDLANKVREYLNKNEKS